MGRSRTIPFLFSLVFLFLFLSTNIAHAGGMRIFPDIPEGHWAEKDIAKMKFKEVVKGYTDGYHPNEGLNREQAVVMLIRVAGLDKKSTDKTLEEAVEDKAVTPWYDQVSDWAERDITTAVEEGILTPDDEKDFRPKDEIKRYEAAVLAARAMGLKEADQGEVNLHFADSDKIPQWSRSSVEAMFEYGIIAGYPDNTFRPEERLTRAQIASVLSRIDSQIDRLNENVAKGEVGHVGKDNTLRILDSTGGERTYEIIDEPFVYDGRYEDSGKLPLISIMEGHKVELLKDTEGRVSYIEIIADDDFIIENDGPVDEFIVGTETLEGEIVDLLYIPDQRLTIKFSNGENKTYPMDSQCKISKNGRKAIFSDLAAGDFIVLEVKNNKITDIDAEVERGDNEGCISAITITRDHSRITISNKKEDREYTYDVDAQTIIRKNRKRIDLREVNVGDYAEVEVEGKRIRRMNLENRSLEEHIVGEIVHINKRLELIRVESVEGLGEAEDIYLGDASVYSSGKERGFSYLRDGDKVIAIGKWEGGVFYASEVVVTSP